MQSASRGLKGTIVTDKPPYPPIRRFVTGHDAKKTAKVIMQGPATNAKYPSPGTVSTMIWSTSRHLHRRERRGPRRAHHRHGPARERPPFRRDRFSAGKRPAHAPHRDDR